MLSEEDRNGDLNLVLHQKLTVSAHAKEAVFEFAQIDGPKLERLLPLLACCSVLLMLQLRVDFDEELLVRIVELSIADPERQNLNVGVKCGDENLTQQTYLIGAATPGEYVVLEDQVDVVEKEGDSVCGLDLLCV